jgi:hypothetical protein
MVDQLFSLATILSLVGVLGFRLAGKKVWWAWYVNIAAQVLWVIFAISIEQYGLLIGVVFYTWVFGKNAYEWTMDHRDPMRGFDFNEVATAGIDRGPHPEFNMGYRGRGKYTGQKPPDGPGGGSPSPIDWERSERRKDVPLFKYRGEVPDESALSYRPEDLLETGRDLASQREDLIAQGVDPAELEVPLAPVEELTGMENVWICGTVVCRTSTFESVESDDWDSTPHSKDPCPECNAISWIPWNGVQKS